MDNLTIASFIKSTSEWREASADSGCFWLLCPSGYLVAAGGHKFAVDLVASKGELPMLLERSITNMLSGLEFMIITHEHEDHFDKRLIKALNSIGTFIYTPHFIHKGVYRELGIPDSRIISMRKEEVYSLPGLEIDPFRSCHVNEKTKVPCGEYGITLRFDGKTVFMPADVRKYDTSLFPNIKADTMFTHVWLGHHNALNLPCQPELDELCRFIAAYSPKRVFLTHLYDYDRPSEDRYTAEHGGLIRGRLHAFLSECEIIIPTYGRRYEI